MSPPPDSAGLMITRLQRVEGRILGLARELLQQAEEKEQRGNQ